MSRLQMFQATLLTATLTVVVLGAATLHPPQVDARTIPAIAQNAGTTGEAPAVTAARRAPGREDLQPNGFGSWWKKFKKFFRLVIEFIDGWIDSSKDLIADASPDGSYRPDRWSPTMPGFPEPQPQPQV